MKSKHSLLLFSVLFFLGLLLAAAAYFEKGQSFLRFFWSPVFLFCIRIFSVAAFGLLVLKWLSRKPLPRTILQWVYGILFLPLVLLPVFRCYFKVPYIFCRVCPTQCPWGLSRTFIFNSFLLLNCSGKFWCTALCPLGTFQECQSELSPKRLKPVSWLIAVAYLMLLVWTTLYFLTLFGSKGVCFFDIGKYEWVALTGIVAGLIFVAAFFVPKFFCRYFCPVGTIAELTSSFQAKKKNP